MSAAVIGVLVWGLCLLLDKNRYMTLQSLGSNSKEDITVLRVELKRDTVELGDRIDTLNENVQVQLAQNHKDIAADVKEALGR